MCAKKHHCRQGRSCPTTSVRSSFCARLHKPHLSCRALGGLSTLCVAPGLLGHREGLDFLCLPFTFVNNVMSGMRFFLEVSGLHVEFYFIFLFTGLETNASWLHG